jgi:predicted TPR repeat methyltransferase
MQILSSAALLLGSGALPCSALSPTDAATKYDSYSSSYDVLDGGKASSALGIDQARNLLLQKARGNVLEIGVGTGLNLDSYDKTKLPLTLVDVSDGILREATARARLTTVAKEYLYALSRTQLPGGRPLWTDALILLSIAFLCVMVTRCSKLLGTAQSGS